MTQKDNVNQSDSRTMEARYSRAQYIRSGMFNNKLHFNDTVFPVWIEGHDCFWYERTLKRGQDAEAKFGKEYRLVNAASASNDRAFDHDRFASALAKASGEEVDGFSLPIERVSINLDPLIVAFAAFDKNWIYDASSRLCKETPTIQKNWMLSPDEQQALFVQEGNIWVRDLATEKEKALTDAGRPDYAYATPSTAWGLPFDPNPYPQARWSPDGEWIFTVQHDAREVKNLPIMHHIPEDGSMRPQIKEVKVAYSGDEHIETYRLVMIHVASGREQAVEYQQIPVSCGAVDMFEDGLGWWSADSMTTYFVDMSRDYKRVRLMACDIATGITRVVLEETSETHLNMSQSLDESSTYMPLPKSDEVLWWSERSGWAHLYLYDLNTGELKNTVTQGDWVVRDTLYFDDERRELYAQTAGRVEDRDPYYRDLVRINVDTGEITTLTDSDHDVFVSSDATVAFKLYPMMGASITNSQAVSPNGNYTVITRTRADEVSVSLLIDREGNECLTLEQTDISSLPENWRWPEPVKTIAADGETDIYGLIFKPSDFDPAQSYPVISNVFNAPETCVARGSFHLAKTLNVYYLDAAALAELGFIVVCMDGRGTPWRSKAFQDASYGCYPHCSLLDDHVAGLKQLAESDSSMDLARVGIYSATGASGCVLGLLDYPDFYRVGINGTCFHDSRLQSATMMIEKYEGLSGPAYPPLEEKADRLEGKLLLIHGMLNNEFPVAGTFRIAQALMDANKDFDVILLPKDGHFLATDYLTRRIWDYLTTHLMGVEPPNQFHLKLGS